VAFGRPLPRVLTAMCLQLLAFIAAGVPARRCANEACGRFFSRQRGRAAYGQTRRPASSTARHRALVPKLSGSIDGGTPRWAFRETLPDHL
jgi:hypothetical protein